MQLHPGAARLPVTRLLLLCLLAVPLAAQSPESKDSTSAESSSLPPKTNEPKPEPQEPAEPSLRTLPRDILLDQRTIWLAPLRIRRKHTPGLILVGGLTGAMLATDHMAADGLASMPPDDVHSAANRFGRFSGGQVDLAIAGGFYALGRMTRNERARATGVLGMRAVLDSIILVEGLKSISRRQRPSFDNGTPRNDAEGRFFRGGRAFPSGHAAQAWALATVVAKQYRHKRWVPFVAYGLATSVALSRIPARKHYPSDVFIGSTLGFLVGRYVWDSAQAGDAISSQRRWQILPYVPSGGGAGAMLSIDF